MSFWASFLGSGIAVAILNWLFSNQAKRVEREVGFLEKQLKEVYGPMYLFASHGKKLFELAEEHGKLAERYLKVGQGGFHDDRLIEEFDKDIDIRNEYIKNIREDGNSVRKILATSYYLVDNDDFDLFQRFLLDYKRLDVEFEESGELKTPRQIYNEIEPPYFSDLELVEQVESKFRFKKKRLNQLSKDNSNFTVAARNLLRASRGVFSEWAIKLLRSLR